MNYKIQPLKHLANWINFVLVAGILSSCATAGKHTLPQSGDMTMAQIYQQQTGLYESHTRSKNLLSLKNAARENYERPNLIFKKNKLLGFKQLPNPEILIYVYPHFVRSDGESQPVPAYTTAFFLYQKNHFATLSHRLRVF